MGGPGSVGPADCRRTDRGMVMAFEIKQARREQVPVMVGLMGPSGSGKTYRALRLATGIQSVSGGEICVIDTESRRALHYADDFRFLHMQFDAPFGPGRYLEAIKAAYDAGARTIVVDSMSHEHEGPGGVLEMHERELQRMGGQDRHNFPAWAKPKAERRAMINGILQIPANFIFCFRAKDKTKPGTDASGKKSLIEQGCMPIAGEEFVFEMTANCLLLPGAAGVPVWRSDYPGERAMMKRPRMFERALADGRQLTEQVGAELALWARGQSPDDEERLSKLEARGREAAEMGKEAKARFWRSLTAADQAALTERAKRPAPAIVDETTGETLIGEGE